MRQREDAMEGVSRCALAVPQCIPVFKSSKASLTSSPFFRFPLVFVNFRIAFVASNIFGNIAILLVDIHAYSVCM